MVPDLSGNIQFQVSGDGREDVHHGWQLVKAGVQLIAVGYYPSCALPLRLATVVSPGWAL